MNNSYPKNVAFYLTEYCNMKCSFCPHAIHQQHNFTRTHFNADAIREVAENAIRFGIYGDGEPLLSPIFLDCIPNPVSDNCEFLFYTSGIPLSIKIIKALIQKRVTWILFSIDAGDKKTYEKMRGNYWNKLWHNIRKTIELKEDRYKPFLCANMMICNSNIHTLPLLVQKLADLNSFYGLTIYRPSKIAETSIWANGNGVFYFDKEISADIDKEYLYISKSIDIARNNNFNLMAVGHFLNHDYQHTTM